MTDVFNIDFEVDSFRKNNLDWRKFRDNYNRVSATKRRRGIQPLPLSLLLKLFGPPKVLNTYVITRRPLEELDYSAEISALHNDISMKTVDKDKERDPAVTKTLDFPGTGLLATNGEDDGKVASQTLKRDALPCRPIFQRNVRVPGRLFPKPAGGEGDHVTLSITLGDCTGNKDSDRQKTARIVTNHSNVKKRGTKSLTSRTSKGIVRGTVCKPTEVMGLNMGRSPTLSSLSTTPAKSLPTLSTNGFAPMRKVNNSLEDLDNGHDLLMSMPINYRYEDRPNTISGAFYDHNGELTGDFNAGQRLRYSTRQVTFPKTGTDFIAVLHGRPKTLHRRELGESMEFPEPEPRSKTHVGFITDG